ncbi:hypothetical protein SUDANB176_06520 [Streptomyces sp. enrichment culture]|uniref:polyprenyl synthetase family protein n=1 Tax=Streptomyces sp. enrichment culture TaxID=1795815 RepID=UPI003F565B8E
MKNPPVSTGEESPPDDGLAQIQDRLRQDLALVAERLRSLVAPPHEKIRGPIMYAVQHTGRLLRPTLALLSSYLLDGEPDAAARRRVVDAAAAVEILHVATLYHDDLIDNARIRRGRPTANAEYGDALALLTGDYLLARCLQSAASLGPSRTACMTETLIDVCAGQMLESSQLFDPLRSEEDYLTTISGKTARLMRCATAMGALQCDASDDARAALESFGHHLGMAFQIWDDILDLSGPDTGKQIAKDLHNGVYTLPVIYAVKDYPDRVLPALREQPLSAVRCREIVDLLHESGAIARAAEVARRHVADALRAVETHPGFTHRAPAVGRYLRGMVDLLSSRLPSLPGERAPGHPTGGPDRTEALIRDWLEEYVCRPDERLGRGGAICPFTAPSLRSGSLEIRVRPAGPAPGPGTVTGLMRAALDEFGRIEWQDSPPALRSLIVAFPDLSPSDFHLLDDAHGEVKTLAVARGLMIGQFHPLCEEPAARNPLFPVNRSPVPLVAIRPMAVHDILFLKDRKEWFAAYRQRFGGHYRSGRDAEPLFAELFRQARAEHGNGT